jgi:hypothetical protein
MRDGSPIQFLTSDEIDKNREREQHQLDEIERLLAALETCRELRQFDADEINRLRAALSAIAEYTHGTSREALLLRGHARDALNQQTTISDKLDRSAGNVVEER